MTLRVGQVTAFDEAAGYGTVQEDGGPEWFFHCTAVADGSRAIAVGAGVRFEVVAGHGGRWEATGIEPLGSPA